MPRREVLLAPMTLLGAVLAVLLAAAPAWATTKFAFEVPEGWTDLSGGAPPASMRDLPAEVFVEVQSGKYAAYAVDMSGADDRFVARFNAVVGAASQPMTDRVLEEAVAAMSETGATEIREHGLAEIGGVTVGRVVADRRLGNRQTRTLVYLLPGEGEHAVLTYQATPETFDRHLPVFEAAAAQTKGVAEAPLWDRIQSGALSGAFIGSLFGVLGIGAAALAVRRLRKHRTAG